MFAAQHFLKRGTDGGILIVTGFRESGAVRLKQHCRAALSEVNAGILGITGGQFGMSGEIRKRKRPVGGLVEFIKLAIAVAVGRKHILDMETGEIRVGLSLFHPFEWIFFAFGLGFQFAHWQRMGMLA